MQWDRGRVLLFALIISSLFELMYPGISLKQARELHIQAENLKQQGINPIAYEKIQREKSDNTVKKLVSNWYSNYVEKHLKRPLTIKKQIDLDIIPLLGHRVLDELQTIDITVALDKIVKRGARRAEIRAYEKLCVLMYNYFKYKLDII